MAKEKSTVELSVFETLNAINVNEHVERKQNLTYLSWAWAWAEVKKAYPNAFYTIYENKDGWNYHTDGKTCWVKTGVTINELEHIEYLPVMDFKNKSISAEYVTSFDVNKAIQRSLTKACARHGLGLYIYAGEDLPEDEKQTAQQQYHQQAQPQYQQPYQQPYQPQHQQQYQRQPTTIVETAEEKAVADKVQHALHFDAKKAVDDFFNSLDDKKKKAARSFYETVEYTGMAMEQWGAMQYEMVCKNLIANNKIHKDTGVKIA